jgi:hypothetical protein
MNRDTRLLERKREGKKGKIERVTIVDRNIDLDLPNHMKAGQPSPPPLDGRRMKWASLLLFTVFSDPLSPGVQHLLLLIILLSIRWQPNYI